MTATTTATTTITWIDNVAQWLTLKPGSEFDLARLAEDRLPTDVVRSMTNQGLTTKEIHALIIPERTLKHRRSRQERLSRDESDKAIRTARVLAQAESTLGNREKALHWMRQPRQRFEGRTPIDLLSTEAGGRLVEVRLRR